MRTHSQNGTVELYYETFGNPADPTLLLVNGLGSQCINFKEAFCEKFAANGFQVVRFDNRDVGLSSHLPDGPEYTLADMADDGFAVLDAVGAQQAHIAGWSMGGMIVQTMALAHPQRVLSMTTVMSSPGGVALAADPDVAAVFGAKAPKTRDEAVAQYIAGINVWGSPAFREVERLTADAEAAYDRCFDPKGRARQVAAIARSGSRQEALRSLAVPTLVLHGDADRLVPIDAGRLTHECIPGSTFSVVEGMGHDYPPQLWDTIVERITTHARGVS
ncbi:MAG TPA: alpha/beta fold hydrolase [Acidimicrobiales bacterium]|nr:alpha/beta fold hydrolase [Acidimicrobiales bacterium]